MTVNYKFIEDFLRQLLDCIYKNYIEDIEKDANNPNSSFIDYACKGINISEHQIQLTKIYNDINHPEFKNFIFWKNLMLELNLITIDINKHELLGPKSIAITLTTTGAALALRCNNLTI